MENIMMLLIYILMILQMIIGGLFIISAVKTGERKIKSYIIWELNLFMALMFFIVSTENQHAFITKTGYIILCIAEIMIFITGCFLYRYFYASKKNKRILELYDESVEEYDWEEEYEKVVKYKEKLGYMRHELVKYISLFEEETIEDEKINKRFNDLKRRLQGETKIIYCENKMISAVIEKKLADIIERQIRVETDIKLINISESLLNEVCIIIWLLIENMACRLRRDDGIYIKFSGKETKSNEIYISYYIETDKYSVPLVIVKRSREMSLLRELINKANGSIVLLKKGGKVIETGIFLGGGCATDRMKNKLLLCMTLEILCFLYVIMQIAKGENKAILPAAVSLVAAIILIYVYVMITDSQSHNMVIDKNKVVMAYIKKSNDGIIKALKKEEIYFTEQIKLLTEEILKRNASDDSKSGEEILKVLFESRKKRAEKINIALEIKWNGKECKIDIWDMGHILLNLLDNAIEAADKNAAKDRWIRLEGIFKDNYALIEIVNPYKGQLKIVDGEIKTTKEDERNHGMGLKIVRDVSQKYGMAMDISTGNNIFRVRVSDRAC